MTLLPYKLYRKHLNSQRILRKMELPMFSPRLAMQLCKVPNLTRLDFWTVRKSSGVERGQLSLLKRVTLLSRHDSNGRYLDDDLRLLRALCMAYNISKSRLQHLAVRGLSIKAIGGDPSTLRFGHFWNLLSATDSRNYQLKSELFNTVETLEPQLVIPRRGEDDHPSLPLWNDFEEENLARFTWEFQSLKMLNLSFSPTALWIGVY